MGEWKECMLGNLATIKGGKRLPKGRTLSELPTQHPYIRTRDIDGNKIAINELWYVPDNVFPSIKNYIVEKHDVILSIVGTIGLCSIIPEKLHLANLTENCAKIVNINNKKLEKKFLFYYLISPDGQDEIEKRNVGSTQPIEEVQDYWEQSGLLYLIHLVGGGTPKTSISEYWGGDIPWLSGGDIAANHKSFISNSEKHITDFGLKNSSTKLLPKYATVISARGTVGKYCLLSQPMAFSQSNYGLLPKTEISDCFFFTYLLINHAVEELRSSAYGSVFDTITTATFKEITIPLPDRLEIKKFEQSVSMFFEKIFLNKSQIQTLEKLRDTLLPKLMSGEVRVNFQEKVA